MRHSFGRTLNTFTRSPSTVRSSHSNITGFSQVFHLLYYRLSVYSKVKNIKILLKYKYIHINNNKNPPRILTVGGPPAGPELKMKLSIRHCI